MAYLEKVGSQSIRIRIKHLGKVKTVLNEGESIAVKRMNVIYFYYTNLKMVLKLV